MYKTVPVWKREPVRVLSLFGDIRKGECGDRLPVLGVCGGDGAGG